MSKNLKIACYGFVEKNAGSGSGARFAILEELLKREVQVDFYSIKNFTYLQDFLEYQNFKHFYVKRPFIASLADSIQGANNLLFIRDLQSRLLREKIFYNHQNEKYDLLMSLGYHSEFQLEDVPVISWLQGPPQSQWYFIQKLRKKIISLCGISLYIKLKAFYALKARQIKSKIFCSDILICGSQWSKDRLIEYGFKPKNVKALSYPIDLNFFKLINSHSNEKRDSKVFLWLGRSEPRKRLDLLLEAYGLLLQERQDVKLKIFGGFAWAQGYKNLIDQFKFPEYIEYQPFINKAKVPELMAQSDVLIQPSEGENFGFSVAEALCCGLPVIVGSTNGTKDYISSSSFIFSEYTPESLKETMLKVIEAIECDRRELSTDARKTAEENFDISHIVDSLENIFQEAINS